MSGSDPQPDRHDEAFVRAIRQQARRAARASDHSFWQGLSLVGAVGWLVALPAVAGALAGRFLDAHFGTGIFWTLPLLLLGVVLGCYSAWRYVQREMTR